MTAKSWETKTLEALRQAPGYIEVEFEFCTMGMVSSDNEGEAPVKKRTRIGTNCPAVAEALAVMQCAGGHRHVQLLQGRASACQQYPVYFCKVVCRAVARQLDRDLKSKRVGPRMKAVITSVSNQREDVDQSFGLSRQSMNCSCACGALSVSPTISRISSAYPCMCSEPVVVEAHDCTGLMEALLEKEREEGESMASGRIFGVQRSEEQQAKSTEEANERIKEKERRRREEQERWNMTGHTDTHERGLECAREMARLDHPHEEEHPNLDWYYGPGYFTDDVKGGLLDKQQCIDARRLEMDYFRRMGVYRKIKRSEVPAGARIITTKWVDTNKGTEDEPNYRSRLVGREIKTDDRPDLFAATPPLESLRYVLSLCASTQDGPKPH